MVAPHRPPRSRHRRQVREAARGALRHPHRRRSAAALPAQVQRRHDGARRRRGPRARRGRARHLRRRHHRCRREADETTAGQAQRSYAVVTLGNRRPKVTATFFNADYLVKQLPEGTRVMLSGEVSYFRQVMQLTHPAFLVLDGSGQGKGSKSLAKIAEGSRRRGRPAGGLRTGLLPDLCGQRQGAELGHLRVRAPGARRARSGRGSVARKRSAAMEFVLRGRGASRDPPRRTRGGPRPGQGAARLRRGRRPAVGAGRAQVRRAQRDGPACAAAGRRAGRGAARRAPVRADAGPDRRARRADRRNSRRPGRCTGCCRARSARARRSFRCWPCCRWSTPDTNARCWRRRKSLPPNMPGRSATCSARWAWRVNSAAPTGRPGWRCSPDR